MTLVGCGVNNCSYYASGNCSANKISVNGKKAKTSNGTCCSTFVNEAGHNAFSSSTLDNNQCNSLNCTVKTCVNNAGTVCALKDISITSNGDSTNSTSDTYCRSFRCKK